MRTRSITSSNKRLNLTLRHLNKELATLSVFFRAFHGMGNFAPPFHGSKKEGVSLDHDTPLFSSLEKVATIRKRPIVASKNKNFRKHCPKRRSFKSLFSLYATVFFLTAPAKMKAICANTRRRCQLPTSANMNGHDRTDPKKFPAYTKFERSFFVLSRTCLLHSRSHVPRPPIPNFRQLQAATFIM